MYLAGILSTSVGCESAEILLGGWTRRADVSDTITSLTKEHVQNTSQCYSLPSMRLQIDIKLWYNLHVCYRLLNKKKSNRSQTYVLYHDQSTFSTQLMQSTGWMVDGDTRYALSRDCNIQMAGRIRVLPLHALDKQQHRLTCVWRMYCRIRVRE
jgi:hypothetical protein